MARFSDMISRRKAQAAAEFLMTYGWALLVVAAGIAALAYFGVMNPARFMPESCTLPATAGMACLDSKITTDTATVLLTNSGGRDVRLFNITIGECTTGLDMDFNDGQKQTFNLTCSYGTAGEKVKEEFEITYSLKDSPLTKTVSGTIIAKIS